MLWCSKSECLMIEANYMTKKLFANISYANIYLTNQNSFFHKK